MKKYQFIMGATFIFIISCTSEKPIGIEKNVIEEFRLIGEINSLIEIEYDAKDKFGEYVKGEIQTKTMDFFNGNGNLIEEKVYESDGSMSKRSVIKYDKLGHKIEGTQYYKDILESRDDYKYDVDGNNIEVNYYNSNGSLSGKSINNFDKTGNEIERSDYNPDGSLKRKYHSKFDKKGNKIEETIYKGDGSLSSRNTKIFDAKGNEIETCYYDQNGNLNSKLTTPLH